MYYAYTGNITFKPLGSKNVEPSVGNSPSDPQFRGCPCSMKELYNLALPVFRSFVFSQWALIQFGQLWFVDLTEVVTAEILSSITLENVIEEMFSGLPLYVPC